MGLWFLYLLSGITGVVRSFNYPAQIALLAQIVPRSMYTEAAAWNSMAWQIAAIGGPAVAGLIYGFAGASTAYAVASSLVLLSVLLLFGLPAFPCPERIKGSTFLEGLSSGLKFVFSKQLLVGSMSLDMFAVLFGGAVALLPVFASEVLNAGPEGLGVLRAAPAIGSIIMSLVLASYPPLRFAGRKLLFSVAMFGVTTILFALSESFYLSMLVLMVGGMFDNVSVVIRSTIVQLFTPDHLRGRVAAVNSVFIGSSNEIGSFESGLAARIMGLVPSVIFGGAMTLGIVGVITIKAPVLRELHLDKEIKE
jgi:MFS family permease